MNCPDCNYINHFQEAPKISYGLSYYECKHPNSPKEPYGNICYGKLELFKSSPEWCPLKKASEKMNALELADELKEISLIADNHTKIVLDIAATMLRQQQAEIEALKMMLANRNDVLDKLDLK